MTQLLKPSDAGIFLKKLKVAISVAATVMVCAGSASAQSSSGGGCTNDNNATVCISFVADGPGTGHLEFYFSVSNDYAPAQIVNGGGASLQACNYAIWGGCGSGYYTTMNGTGQYPTANFTVTNDGDAFAQVTFFGIGGAQRSISSPAVYWTLSNSITEKDRK